jgi:hypothetical protein
MAQCGESENKEFVRRPGSQQGLQGKHKIDSLVKKVTFLSVIAYRDIQNGFDALFTAGPTPWTPKLSENLPDVGPATLR